MLKLNLEIKRKEVALICILYLVSIWTQQKMYFLQVELHGSSWFIIVHQGEVEKKTPISKSALLVSYMLTQQ